MHLSKEVIGQTPVIIQPAEVGAANVADLQLLVSTGPRCVGQCFEFPLAILLHLFQLANLEVFRHGGIDAAQLAEDLDLE